VKILKKTVDVDVSSVMITLGLSDGGLSDGVLSDGMVIKSEQIDGTLPRGLLMLTLALAVGIDGDLGKGTYAGEIALEICVDNSDGSVETSSKSKTDTSRMSVLTEETVETVEGVLVKATEVGLGDSDGVTTVVDDGTRNEGERTVGGREGDDAETDADTIAVGVGESDEEEEEIIGW